MPKKDFLNEQLKNEVIPAFRVDSLTFEFICKLSDKYFLRNNTEAMRAILKFAKKHESELIEFVEKR
jgi:hypothetical protein